ncbi:hypothetical protein [Erysipelatoclostridium sp. MSK.7.34]|uniref:hypothetical protein n=1 Tax=Erysipelatoclostridium sp. MSK.7.34 TaxID=2849178 RepID=UPI003FA52598
MSIVSVKIKVQSSPSGLKPYLIAIASNKVDFPVPFSPTKKVIGLSKIKVFNCSNCI